MTAIEVVIVGVAKAVKYL